MLQALLILLKHFQAYHPLQNIPCNTDATQRSFNVLADHCSPADTTAVPFGIRFAGFLGGAVVYVALATMNAWPNLDAALQGDHKAAAMAFVQYTFAFIVAISSVASAYEKGGQVAVLVCMLVNGYFADDASSHRHDEAHTIISRKAIVEIELAENEKKRSKLVDFERVTADQIAEAKRKRDDAEEAKDCWACSRATRNARAQAAKDAQAALDRLFPLRTRTEEADNLDKAIVQARAELKAFKAMGDLDNSLASMAGANAATLSTAITLVLALGIELANKYGPYWTFRFLISGLWAISASPYERKKAQKAAEKARKAREAEEAEPRRREAERRFAAEVEARAAADAEEKARAERGAKRAAARTRETGNRETVKTWLNSKRVIHAPGHVLPLPAAYVDYEVDCKAHGEISGRARPALCGRAAQAWPRCS